MKIEDAFLNDKSGVTYKLKDDANFIGLPSWISFSPNSEIIIYLNKAE